MARPWQETCTGTDFASSQERFLPDLLVHAPATGTAVHRLNEIGAVGELQVVLRILPTQIINMMQFRGAYVPLGAVRIVCDMYGDSKSLRIRFYARNGVVPITLYWLTDDHKFTKIKHCIEGREQPLSLPVHCDALLIVPDDYALPLALEG
jgi:hypothetical protein